MIVRKTVPCSPVVFVMGSCGVGLSKIAGFAVLVDPLVSKTRVHGFTFQSQYTEDALMNAPQRFISHETL